MANLLPSVLAGIQNPRYQDRDQQQDIGNALMQGFANFMQQRQQGINNNLNRQKLQTSMEHMQRQDALNKQSILADILHKQTQDRLDRQKAIIAGGGPLAMLTQKQLLDDPRVHFGLKQQPSDSATTPTQGELDRDVPWLRRRTRELTGVRPQLTSTDPNIEQVLRLGDKQQSGGRWSSLPEGIRKEILSKGAVLGESMPDLINFINAGGDIQELADHRGAKWMDINAPTASTLIKGQSRAIGLAGVQKANNILKGLEKTVGTEIFGVHPSQIASRIKNVGMEILGVHPSKIASRKKNVIAPGVVSDDSHERVAKGLLYNYIQSVLSTTTSRAEGVTPGFRFSQLMKENLPTFIKHIGFSTHKSRELFRDMANKAIKDIVNAEAKIGRTGRMDLPDDKLSQQTIKQYSDKYGISRDEAIRVMRSRGIKID